MQLNIRVNELGLNILDIKVFSTFHMALQEIYFIKVKFHPLISFAFIFRQSKITNHLKKTSTEKPRHCIKGPHRRT
jgi:hypothetical protein